MRLISMITHLTLSQSHAGQVHHSSSHSWPDNRGGIVLPVDRQLLNAKEKNLGDSTAKPSHYIAIVQLLLQRKQISQPAFKKIKDISAVTHTTRG